MYTCKQRRHSELRVTVLGLQLRIEIRSRRKNTHTYAVNAVNLYSYSYAVEIVLNTQFLKTYSLDCACVFSRSYAMDHSAVDVVPADTDDKLQKVKKEADAKNGSRFDSDISAV